MFDLGLTSGLYDEGYLLDICLRKPKGVVSHLVKVLVLTQDARNNHTKDSGG